MDRQLTEVGDRIRSQMPEGLTQDELARRIGMAPDALSRALNARRGFSMSELTAIAAELAVELHWIMTGTPDPHRMNVAARHAWHDGQHVNPGRADDETMLARVRNLYRDAFPDMVPASGELPREAREVRRRLGDGFPTRFAEIVQHQFGIDVVRLPGLSTDYSLTIGERSVILLAARPHWYRSNWSLAHELGHLALLHHAEMGAHTADHEDRSDKFAADLLLPRDVVHAQNWVHMTIPELAQYVWTSGVSTAAVRTRLKYLKVSVPDNVATALNTPTPALMRQHLTERSSDAVTDRQQNAAARRFPLRLLTALTRRVEAGDVGPEGLAWALDVPIDDLDFPEPDDDAVIERLRQMHERRPIIGSTAS